MDAPFEITLPVEDRALPTATETRQVSILNFGISGEEVTYISNLTCQFRGSFCETEALKLGVAWLMTGCES